ncbi:MAG: serine hydrolase domain-containing protein [Vicinamibacterales bacterium]
MASHGGGRRVGLGAFAVAALGLALAHGWTDARLSGAAGGPPSTATTASPRDLAPASPESVGFSSERLRRMDAMITRLVDQKRLAGAVTLLTRHGKTVSVSTYGAADVESGAPMRRDTIFRIASMTKPVTAVALMLLYEEGKWRLNDPVSRFIPSFTALKVYGGENADGTPKLEDPRTPMTMRDLMTHTAGLGYVINKTHPVDKLYRQHGVLDSSKPLQAMIDRLATLPLLAQPGSRWYYSIGIDVQGYLVERLSGQPFDEFVQSRIFAPLGMKDTGFAVPAGSVARLARIHAESAGQLTPAPLRGDATKRPAGPSGGGGLFSTADDYARFCQMLLNDGEFNGARLLAPRTVAMMRTNHVQPDALKTMPPGTGWGLGFNVVTDAAAAGEPTPTGTYHWFGINGTWFWIDPASDLAFVGMIQHQGPAAAELRLLSRNLVYQALVAPAQ